MTDAANESATSQLPTPYGYTPTTWICVLFVVLYSLTTLVHLAQATRSCLWWMVPTVVLCGVSEIIGWSGRLWSSYNAQDIDPFLMQCVVCWSQMRKGSPTSVQGYDHHYRAFIPHCSHFQCPRTHNSPGRNAVQLAPTSMV